MKRSTTELLQEMFGEPIGNYAGDVPAGAPDIRAKKESNLCTKCGMKNCQCDHVSEAEACNQCGFMEVEGSCGCTHVNEAKKKKDKETVYPRQYDAPEGSKRNEKLDAAAAAYKRGDIEKAVQIRSSMEDKEREKNEGIESLRSVIQELISEALSKKTKETHRKKAEKRGLTPGSVYAEYRKGLAAWASSGSRKGMSQHQWAMARVNSANPSKSWAVVKKSKSKKK